MPASPQAALALGTPDPAVDAAAAFRNADISLPEAAPAGDNYLDRSATVVDGGQIEWAWGRYVGRETGAYNAGSREIAGERTMPRICQGPPEMPGASLPRTGENRQRIP